MALDIADAQEDVIEAARNWAEVWREMGNGLPASQSVLDLFDAVNRLDALLAKHRQEIGD